MTFRSKFGHVCLQNDPLFQQFIILVSVEGLENKYNLELSRGTFSCGRLTVIKITILIIYSFVVYLCL